MSEDDKESPPNTRTGSSMVLARQRDIVKAMESGQALEEVGESINALVPSYQRKKFKTYLKLYSVDIEADADDCAVDSFSAYTCAGVGGAVAIGMGTLLLAPGAGLLALVGFTVGGAACLTGIALGYSIGKEQVKIIKYAKKINIFEGEIDQ